MSEKKIRSIIIDDEPHAVELLDILLMENCPQVENLAKVYTVEEAYEKINLLRPDVIFLDIKLRSKTGFDLLNRFENIFFQVVFTTAYDHYALQAFEYSALHYLMKPIDVSKLETTVKRLENRMLHLRYSDNDQSESPRRNFEKLDKIALSSNNATELIDIADIEYLRAEGSYTSIHLTDQSEKISSRILGHYQSILDPTRFCRVQRKYMVNTDHILRFDKAKSTTLVMSSGTTIQVSQVYKDQLLEALKKRVSF